MQFRERSQEGFANVRKFLAQNLKITIEFFSL